MTRTSDFSLIVGYGTDMGNAEDVAMTFCEAAAAAGITIEAIELNQVEVNALRSATHFVVATSTFGDGEFPDTANLFWEAISAETERLDHLSFAVLALGDSSYELFCNAGRLLDERLEALGATRLVERVDVDGAYAQPAAAWTADVVKLVAAAHTNPALAVAVAPRERNLPVDAQLVVNRLLTAPESGREVRHYELELTSFEIAYRAGDSIAVHATNDPHLVDAILAELGVGPEHEVADQDEPLGILLGNHLEIRMPSRALRALAAARTHDQEAATGDGCDVLDLIRLADLRLDEVVDTLRPLQCRDYSISSSPLVHPDRVHLTVATVRYPGVHRGQRQVVKAIFGVSG